MTVGIRRLAALLVTCSIVLAGAVTAPAEAHAFLVSSDPADGTRLTSAPSRLRLSFSEHVVVQATNITVVDTAGHPVGLTAMHLVTHDPSNTEGPATIVASFAHPLRTAAYRVSWQTLSSDDLHRTAGVFVFGVGRTVQATALQESMPSVEEASLRSGFLLGLALALGGLLAASVERRTRRESQTPRRLAAGGVVVALAMSVLLLASQLLGAHAGPASTLLSAYGVRWALRSVGLIVLLASLRLDRSRWRSPTRWLGTALACLGTAALGHAGSGTSSPSRLAADAAHIAATLSWGGAVVCLAIALVGRNGAGLRDTLRAFAGPAAACLTVAVMTGIYLSSWVVGSVDAVLLTFYGRTLMVKLAVVGAAAGLGLVNHLRLRRGPDARLPRRSVPAEACAVVGAVLLTAVLTSSQPATEPTFVHEHVVADTVPAVGQLADLEVSAGVRPNRPGDAIAVVDVFDTRRPAPATVTGVAVNLGGQSPVEAQPLGDGHWSVHVTAVRAGATSIGVRIHRVGEPDVTGSFSWTVGTGPGARPATVSQAPLRASLRVVATALGGVLTVLWGAALLLRGRRSSRRAATQRVEAGAAA